MKSLEFYENITMFCLEKNFLFLHRTVQAAPLIFEVFIRESFLIHFDVTNSSHRFIDSFHSLTDCVFCIGLAHGALLNRHPSVYSRIRQSPVRGVQNKLISSVASHSSQPCAAHARQTPAMGIQNASHSMPSFAAHTRQTPAMGIQNASHSRPSFAAHTRQTPAIGVHCTD